MSRVGSRVGKVLGRLRGRRHRSNNNPQPVGQTQGVTAVQGETTGAGTTQNGAHPNESSSNPGRNSRASAGSAQSSRKKLSKDQNTDKGKSPAAKLSPVFLDLKTNKSMDGETKRIFFSRMLSALQSIYDKPNECFLITLQHVDMTFKSMPVVSYLMTVQSGPEPKRESLKAATTLQNCIENCLEIPPSQGTIRFLPDTSFGCVVWDVTSLRGDEAIIPYERLSSESKSSQTRVSVHREQDRNDPQPSSSQTVVASGALSDDPLNTVVSSKTNPEGGVLEETRVDAPVSA